MHKISNFTGQARHGWEKMTPSMSFGMSRPHHDAAMPMTTPPVKRSLASSTLSPAPSPGSTINLSFNVPFASNLAGPEVDEIIHASPGAFGRWTHPDGTADGTPNHKLPIHVNNVEALRSLCRQISDSSNGMLHATVTSSEPKPIPGVPRGPLKTLVTNVCLSGEFELVNKCRGKILNDTPISLRCATVDVDYNLIIDPESQGVKALILKHLDDIAHRTKADVFLLHPKPVDVESASFNGNLDTINESRLRIVIYGDMESSEHAKTHVLIMIDQILRRQVDTMRLELSLHTLICGRARKNIKLIESATNTAIYFPPPFPRLYGYTPPGAALRSEDEVIITGESQDNILQAKKRLHDLVMGTKTFVKDTMITHNKIDSILLERLDKVRKIIEANGSYVLLPQLGMQRGVIRVQATDILNVERTVREIMTLAGQFYSAKWSITGPDPSQRPPTPSDIRAMLSDICINSGAEISFEKLNFHIYGSDDAVKAAMMVINGIPFVKKAQYEMRVKIELANEHKEFVSGKKNGKINKIMSQSNVQIMFDGFNEYNFYIDVRGHSYEAAKNGLDLVEQEMPASISFHVPDQYHKRIIGIGGQHIQRIMKKYSVFVKFSNAMDRGGVGKEEDDIKVDNVICRTPARNADNLDLVKQEIMDMVEKVDAEFVSEHVVIDRLYHRELIARMTELEELEKKWNCKFIFPSTEQASDVITVTGPEYQVPLAVDEFLVSIATSKDAPLLLLTCYEGMVPENHPLAFPSAPDLSVYLRSNEFKAEILEKLKAQHEVELTLQDASRESIDGREATVETLVMRFTRNNAGGLRDAIDFLTARLVAHGLDATTIRGAIPRPKSDSFEDSFPYFNSKLLQRAEPPVIATDSPTRSSFGNNGEDGSNDQRSLFDKLRKPGSISSFSSFLERRKNGSNSPGSLFKHASSNASKASLASLESQGSGYRNPWNDSGVNLPDDDSPWAPSSTTYTTTHQSKFPFGAGSGVGTGFSMNSSQTSFSQLPSTSASTSAPVPIGSDSSAGIIGSSSMNVPGDATPKLDASRERSVDRESTRPGTADSNHSGYPGPIGPPTR
ncbi:MAG: hypothetical protein M1821_005411 [Bathelium mastoideum]|nr:MAG: hypothetical protein M1821_005411 [Bathelium mastoideum]